MIVKRPASARGLTRTEWLDSRHSFSFADYRDPAHVHFGPLRVINEDFIAPGAGFPTHPHDNMEIITYVVEGTLAHKDTLGNGSEIPAGDVQAMSAGTGIAHSEFNASATQTAHILQIWIFPDKKGRAPRYQQKHTALKNNRNALRLIASNAANEGAVHLHQNAQIYASYLDSNTSLTHTLTEGRKAWLQLVKGALSINGTDLTPGDGAAITGEKTLSITASHTAEFLLFDVAA